MLNKPNDPQGNIHYLSPAHILQHRVKDRDRHNNTSECLKYCYYGNTSKEHNYTCTISILLGISSAAHTGSVMILIYNNLYSYKSHISSLLKEKRGPCLENKTFITVYLWTSKTLIYYSIKIMNIRQQKDQYTPIDN